VKALRKLLGRDADHDVSAFPSGVGAGHLIEPGKASVSSANDADPARRFDVLSIEKIPAFRASLNLVSEASANSIRSECVVLDTGYSTVVIVCVPAFLARPQYDAIRAAARSENISIDKTITAPKELVSELHRLCEEKQGAGLAIQADNTRHVQLYDDLIRGANMLGASDIHMFLDPRAKSTVRIRVHGRMHTWRQFDTPALVSALQAGFQARTRKGTNSAGSWVPERSLNTMTEHLIGEQTILARLTSEPAYNDTCGIVTRLLKSGVKVDDFPTIEKLGYSPQQCADIRKALAINRGLLLLVGPTGSGKSTSLRSYLYAIPRLDTLAAFSVEEPVEYELPGVVQFSLQTNADDDPETVRNKFNAKLKQLMRMDPDVALLGEIRDSYAASVAAEFARTGHRALATLHGDSAEDALDRAMGSQIAMAPDVLAASCIFGAYQRLMPRLCDGDGCRVPARKVLPQRSQDALTGKFGLSLDHVYCAGEGCEKCWNAELKQGGYMGVELVAETILLTTPGMRELILAKDIPALRRLRRSLRRSAFSDADTLGKTAYEHAIYKASIGLIDPRDIEAEFESLESYEVMELAAC